MGSDNFRFAIFVLLIFVASVLFVIALELSAINDLLRDYVDGR